MRTHRIGAGALKIEAESAAITGKAEVVRLAGASGGKVVASSGPATLTFEVNSPRAQKATLLISRFKKPRRDYDYEGYRRWAVNGKRQPVDPSYFAPQAELYFAELEAQPVAGMKRVSVVFLPGLRLKKGKNRVSLRVPACTCIDHITITPSLELRLRGVDSPVRDFIYFDDQEKAEFTIRLKNAGKGLLNLTGSVEAVPLYVGGTTLWDAGVYIQDGLPKSYRVKGLAIAAGGDGEVKFSFKPRGRMSCLCILRLSDGKREFIAHTHYMAVIFRPAQGFRLSSPFMVMAPQKFSEGPVWGVFEKVGMKWVRAETKWCECEQSEGQFDWTFADGYARMARRHKIYIMNLTECPPEYILPNGKQMYRDQTPHPSRMADWSKFWRMFVVRYKDVVRALNFWNEPWEHGGISSWHCDGAHFRRMLKATWEGIHDLRPKVLFAAADSAHNTDWKIFAAGYEKYVDVLSNHYAPPWANYCPALARRGKKKVWETESWLGLRPDHTVIRRTINILAYGSTMVSLWHQNNFTRGRGIDFGQLPNGVAGVRGGPTPNVVPTSALTHFLEDTKFDKRVSADGLPFMFLFKGKGRSVCAVTSAINPGKPWDQACEAWQASEGIENGKPPPSGAKPFGIRSKGSITLKDPGRKLQAFDMYGNPIRQKGKGQLTVPVSHEVVYVTSKGKHGEFAKALSGARMKGIRPVQIILHDFAAPMDMLPSLDVELRNAYNVPIHGRITVTAAEGLEFENAARKFKIGKAHGRLNIAFKLKSARASRFNAYPVKVEVETDQGVAGLEEVLSVTCAVKGTPKIDGNLDDWQALGAIPVIFVSGVGNPMSIPVWEPWSKVAKRWRGKFAARCATMWDDKYFYFMADVQDDSKACHESLFLSGDLNKYRPSPYEHVYERFGPEPEWATNSVQLAFDCGLWTKPKQFYNIHAPKDPLWGTGPVYSADYSYALYPTKKHDPELFRYRREDFYWAHALPIDYKWVARHCQVKGARLAMKSDRAGYRYEVALPLAEVRRLEPKVGKGFRFSFQVSSGGPFNNINWSAWKSACFKTALDFEPTHTANWSGNAPWGFVGPRK